MGGFALLDEAILPEASEDVLDDGGVLVGRSAAEDVKVEPEPVIDILVDGVIFGTQRGRVHALGERLCLGSSTILIRTAHIDGWKTPRPTKPGKDVGGLRGSG